MQRRGVGMAVAWRWHGSGVTLAWHWHGTGICSGMARHLPLAWHLLDDGLIRAVIIMSFTSVIVFLVS